MNSRTLFFDLDDTLYPSGNGLWDAIRQRMNRFMLERLRIPEQDVLALRKHYYETYGTTLKGLQLHYDVDVDEYLAYVHDLSLDAYLKPDPAMRSLLLSLSHPKWIFTNADLAHARRVLSVLGLEACFCGIIDVRALDFTCKPQETAYHKALVISGAADPARGVLFDDSPRNLAPARSLGFFTVLVGKEEPDPAACRSVRSLLQLPEVFPELWIK